MARERTTPWVPWFVLGVTLLLTFAAARAILQAEADEVQSRFENAANSAEDRVRQRMAVYVAILRAGAGLLAAEPEVSADEFHAFALRLRLEEHYPGTLGIGFAMRARSETEVLALVRRMRGQGETRFEVWPKESSFERFPILFLEPQNERNRVALGYDMYSEAVRREAMDRARDSGEPAVSAKVSLVQEITGAKQPGFLIYLPVYRGGAIPERVEERRERLTGFVYCPIRAVDLFEGIFGQEQPTVSIEIFDGPAVDLEQLLYDSGHPEDSRHGLTRPVVFSGRTWTLRYFALRTPWVERAAGWVLALGGTVAGLTLFLVTRASERLRRRKEDLARLYDAVLRNMPAGLLVVGPSGAVVAANDRARELLGPAAAEPWLQAERAPVLFRLDGRPYALAELPTARVHKEGVPVVDEEVVQRTPGRPARRLMLSAAPVLEGHGRVRVAVLLALDITERRRAEEARQRAEERLAVIAEAGRRIAEAPLSVHGVLETLCAHIAQRLGDRCEISLVEGEELHLVAAAGGAAAASTSAQGLAARVVQVGSSVRGDGESGGWLGVPMRGRDGRVRGAICLTRAGGRPAHSSEDQTALEEIAVRAGLAVENAELHEQTARSLAATQELVRMNDLFVSMLGHDLRNPLTAIGAGAQLLLRRGVDERTRPPLERIVTAAQRMARMIEQLLDYSRSRLGGGIPVQRRACDLGELARQLVDEARQSNPQRALELEVRGDPRGEWDPDRLAQVVSNLLGNAIEHGGPGPVRVALDGGGASLVRLSVHNAGFIPPQVKEVIFEPFRRGERSTKGLGLGLYITRSIVLAHGGQLSVESEPEAGTTFTVELERHPSAAAPSAEPLLPH